MTKLQQFDWVVKSVMFDDPEKPVTVSEVMERYNWTHGRAQRCLDRLVKHGVLKRRVKTFWNGMHYAQRFYYW